MQTTPYNTESLRIEVCVLVLNSQTAMKVLVYTTVQSFEVSESFQHWFKKFTKSLY